MNEKTTQFTAGGCISVIKTVKLLPTFHDFFSMFGQESEIFDFISCDAYFEMESNRNELAIWHPGHCPGGPMSNLGPSGGGLHLLIYFATELAGLIG